MERAWFAPKRYGYGAGLPIAWQGWVVLGVYVAALVLDMSFLPVRFADPEQGRNVALAIAFVLTGALIWVCAKTTVGGWRWRWGGD
jgi:hypothetical protein